MKIQKSIISAIIVGVSISLITCSKNEKPMKTITIKIAEGKDSTVYIGDCPACGQG